MSNPSELFTPFLPATQNVPEEQDRLNVFLVDQLNIYADVVNDKKIGTYVDSKENFNGEKWFYITPKTVRNGYETFVFISSYPNAGTLTVDLSTTPTYPITSVDPSFVITISYGTASKPCSALGAGDGDYFSFMNQGDSRITFTMSDNKIIITTTTDLRAYKGFIIIHYLRNGV